MAWPTNPINGQQVAINGITYQYNSTDTVWNRVGQESITISNDSFTTNGLYVTGLTTLQQSSEIINTKTGGTGTVIHDISTGSTFYHSSMAANFTANFTNVPTTNNRGTAIVLVLAQGATPYYPSSIQINSSATTLKWVGAVTPVPTGNRVEIVTFVLLRVGSAWTAIGQLTSYG
jgi:hypothetical protein